MKSITRWIVAAIVGVGAASSALAEVTAVEFVRLKSSKGDIVIELNREKAPVTVENFLSYTDKGYYDGTIFHRVIDNFMIQGGGHTEDMVQKPTDPPIKNEWRNGLKNNRGTIAMARLGNQPDSATSQFFINVKDNAALDQPRDGAAYAVFGRVVRGMEVVDAIKAVKTTTKGAHQNVPEETVFIEKMERITDTAELAGLRQLHEQEQARAVAERTDVIKPGIDYLRAQGVDVSAGRQLPSGLWILDATAGEGAQPTERDRVEVHYTGWLVNGTQFDSSRDRGQPAQFPLSGVVAGWREGVSQMKEGGRSWLVIPPSLGYGERGGGPIPPNSVLVFDVELLKVLK